MRAILSQTTSKRRVILTSLFTAAIAGLGSSSAPAQPLNELFQQHHLDTGPRIANRQTVLTGFLRQSQVADVVVLHVDENNERTLQLYGFGNETWMPDLLSTIRENAQFVDVVRIAGTDRLVTYSDERLLWFDPATSSERELPSVPNLTSDFLPPRGNEIPHLDISHDLNKDGLDDLVVPDGGGFWILVQQSEGAFAAPVKIGGFAEMDRILGADGTRYDAWSQARVHDVDVNGDGRGDLVYWQQDHFRVHLQTEEGLFARDAGTFAIDVAFDSDQLSTLASGAMVGRVLHSFTDLNADGIADLVVLSLEGNQQTRKRSSAEIHFGKASSGGGLAFESTPDSVVDSGRVQVGLSLLDVDGDGELELMIETIDRKFFGNNLFMRFRGGMGGEVYVHIDFHQLQDARYRGGANTTRRTELQYPGAHRGPGWVPLDLVLRGGQHQTRLMQEKYSRSFNAITLIGDVTGDGRADLVRGHDRRSMPCLRPHKFDRLRVYPGIDGVELFTDVPLDTLVPMPDDGEYVWFADLNSDNKSDIVIHHPTCCRGDYYRDPTNEGPRLTLLIAE